MTFRLANLSVALLLLSAFGCASQQHAWSPRDNSAFTNVVQSRFEQSHPLAQSKELAAIADLPLGSDLEPIIDESASEVRAQSPDGSSTRSFGQFTQNNPVQSLQSPAYQYPETGQPSGGIVPSFVSGGAPASQGVGGFPIQGGGNQVPIGQNYTDYQNFADLDVFVGETRTGSIQLGGAFNSDLSLIHI